MHSAAALPRPPTEESDVENPPVAIVVMAWTTASNPPTPTAMSSSTQATVRPR